MVATDSNRDLYQWVWVVKSVHVNKGEEVPMKEGDRLFICVEPDGAVHFRHRNRNNKTDENSRYWDGAEATMCEQSGEITGGVNEGKRRFTMDIKSSEKGYTLHCKHVRNPEEGEWDADDGWDPV